MFFNTANQSFKSKASVAGILLCLSASAFGQNYYVDPASGSDNNDGTSPTKAIKSLNQVQKIPLKAGDELLLAAGKIHWGELKLHDLNGAVGKPIKVSSYQSPSAPNATHAIINAKGFYNGVSIRNANHLIVSNLKITAPNGEVHKWLKKQQKFKKSEMRIGVKLEAVNGFISESVNLNNLIISDIYMNPKGVSRSFKETHTANGTESYGWGIRAFAKQKGKFNNLVIQDNLVANVSHTGIKLNGPKDSLTAVSLSNNQVLDVGGPGMQMSGGFNVHVNGNKVENSGSTKDSRNWGRGSGMWTWGTSHALVEHNQFLNANGPGDSAGFHIDFNCDNIIIQYNLSANNAGGFIEVLGNNYNNAYRYNVSINDGHRIKKKGVAFQEGKTFWLSGFNGKNKPHNGPFNTYVYNNTIYVKQDIVSKVAVTRMSKGVLVANNIFHVVGDSKEVKGDQYRPEAKGINHISDVLFQNNLFLKESNWPEAVLIKDNKPVYGNAKFAKPGGFKIEDYIPQNLELVKDKGIQIPKINNDKNGLFLGQQVSHDILGNPIVGLPDMGAIEIAN